jgi:hypothetical protein
MPIIFWVIGVLLFLFSVLNYKNQIVSSRPKENYKNEKWLKSQFYEKGKSLQEIANQQNVSMMKIEEEIRKIEKYEEYNEKH